MDVGDALRARRTVRAFLDRPVPRETIEAILADALHTPSWANTQPWEIFVAGGEILEGLRLACLENVRNGVPATSDLPRPEQWPAVIEERMRQQYAKRFQDLGIDRDDQEARRAAAENNGRFFGAPAVVYLCMDRTLTPWSVHDLGMMSQSIMLASAEKGIASAIAFNLVIYPDLIRKALEIPEEMAIIIGIALGYADASNAENSYHGERRPLDEVVRLSGF